LAVSFGALPSGHARHSSDRPRFRVARDPRGRWLRFERAAQLERTSDLGPGLAADRHPRRNIGSAVEVHPLGWDAYFIELTVNGAGADDCARPRFAGVDAQADVLVARFERPAVTGMCLVTSTAAFDVLLERRFIPVGVSRFELSESCGNEQPGPGFPRNGIPIVGPGGTSLPEPSESLPAAG
jgi:hypothetical protein